MDWLMLVDVLNGDDVDVMFLVACNNLLKLMSVWRVVSAKVRNLYVASLRAWPMFGALRLGAWSETWLRIAPFWSYFVMARLLSSSRFSVLFGSDSGSVCCASIFVKHLGYFDTYWDTKLTQKFGFRSYGVLQSNGNRIPILEHFKIRKPMVKIQLKVWIYQFLVTFQR